MSPSTPIKIQLAFLVAAASFLFVATDAQALSPFKKAFDEKYVKPSGNADFQAAFKKAACNTCHVKGQEKEHVNAYGKSLADLIEGDAHDRLETAKKEGEEQGKAAEAKLLEELAAAFTKAEAAKSPAGKTYGEMFKAGELPTADGAVSLKETK